MPVGLPIVFPIDLPEGPLAVSIPLNEILNAIVLLLTGDVDSGGGPFPSGEGPLVTFEGDDVSVDLGDGFDFSDWDGGDAPGWELPPSEDGDGGEGAGIDDAPASADAFAFGVDLDAPLT